MTNQQKHSRSIPKVPPQLLLKYSPSTLEAPPIHNKHSQIWSIKPKSIWKRSVLTMFKYIPTALLNSLFDYRLKTIVKRAKSEIGATTIQIMKAYKKATN